MVKGKNIFDYINAINNKNELQYDKKIASPYMLAMWLSHDWFLLPIVNDMNKHLFKHKPKAVYQYFYDKIPKKKRYIKWVKKQKISDEDDKLIEKLMAKYQMSKEEAKRCLIK